MISSLKDHVTYNPEAQKKAQYFTRILDRYDLLTVNHLFKKIVIQISGSKFTYDI